MKSLIETNEFAPYYATYINLAPEGDITEILTQQMVETTRLLNNLTDQQAQFRYSEGKWSIKEVIGHLMDTERVMGYRLLSFARGEKAELPGYDDNAYVENGMFNNQTLSALLKHWEIVRQSTIQLIKYLPEEACGRRGIANGSEVTVRALMYIIAGHEVHHRNIIEERYIRAETYPVF